MLESLESTREVREIVIAALAAASEMGMSAGEAVEMTRSYLATRGLPEVPDPIAFATEGRHTMQTGDLSARLVVRP